MTLYYMIFIFLSVLSAFDLCNQKVPRPLIGYFFITVLWFMPVDCVMPVSIMLISYCFWYALAGGVSVILGKQAMGSADLKILSIVSPFIAFEWIAAWFMLLGVSGIFISIIFKEQGEQTRFAFVPAIFTSFFILEIFKCLL
jgi:prepilin signal peptidase PulO-like enzyme (type II secretory pathway)